MTGRLNIPLSLPWLVLGAAAAMFFGGVTSDVDTNSTKVDATAATTQDVDAALSSLREASEKFCERVNDSRKDLVVVKRDLGAVIPALIAAALSTSDEERLRERFRRELRRLGEPQPTLTCADFR